MFPFFGKHSVPLPFNVYLSPQLHIGPEGVNKHMPGHEYPLQLLLKDSSDGS